MKLTWQAAGPDRHNQVHRRDVLNFPGRTAKRGYSTHVGIPILDATRFTVEGDPGKPLGIHTRQKTWVMVRSFDV